jgi:hypothetical protein
MLNPESGGHTRYPAIPFSDVDRAAGFEERLELLSVTVAAERAREKVAQRPGVLVRMHVPCVVHVNAVLPKKRLQLVPNL